jgi:hypothetical protein
LFSIAGALLELQDSAYLKLSNNVLTLRDSPDAETPRLELKNTLARISVIEELIASPVKKYVGYAPASEYLVENNQRVPYKDGTIADSSLVLAAMERLVVSPFVHVRNREMELILAGPTTWLLGDGKDSHQRKLEELKVEAERLSKEDF